MSSGIHPELLPSPRFILPILKNGLKVYVVPRPELPLVSIHLILPCGAEADPPGRGGLADLSAEMLTLGTQKRSAASWRRRSMDWERSSPPIPGGTALPCISRDSAKTWSDSCRLLLEIYTEPAFSPEEFEQLKQRRIAPAGAAEG